MTENLASSTGAVGVPEIVPSVARDRPFGSDEFSASAHEIVASPVASSC